jgi:hypothetical protein
MNNSYVSSSEVHGLGVFSNNDKDMILGDIITIYPADIVIETINEKSNSATSYVASLSCGRGGVVGEHSSLPNKTKTCNLLISKDLFNLKFSNSEFTKENLIELSSDFFYNYLVRLTDNINISATPELYDNPTYIGHMINDGTKIIPTSSEQINEYNESSQLRANCCFKYYNNLLFVIATKNIKKNEELFVTYGYDYWMSDRNKKME